MSLLDTNEDGEVDLDEFLNVLSPIGFQGIELLDLFHVYDLSGNGKLTPIEFEIAEETRRNRVKVDNYLKKLDSEKKGKGSGRRLAINPEEY